jgi:transcriptional regulator MraZ
LLLGEYEHTIDDKNRLTLPARLRESFPGGVVVVTRGMDRCLSAYPRPAWESFVESRLASLDQFSSQARRLERYLFGSAVEVEIDRQGRIMIPAPLVAYAELARDVVVAGVRDRLEVWDRQAWRTQLKELEGSAEHVAERLAATSG